MQWEITRHAWHKYGDPRLGTWILELATTPDAGRASDLLVIIEAEVVPPSSHLQPSAAPAAACLVQGLVSATSVARLEMLYLLFQLAGGAVQGSVAPALRLAVAREVTFGFPIYAEIAESGTSEERLQCVDLLSMCARFDEYCFGRACSLLLRIAEAGEKEASSVKIELDDLRQFSIEMSW